MNNADILEKAHPLIVSSIKKFAASKGEFSDLYQDGIVHLLQILPSYDESSGVTVFAYFKSQLKYFYLNYGRYSRENYSLNQSVDEEGHELIELIADQGAAIDEKFIAKEQSVELKNAVKSLEAEDRALIKLLYLEDLTLEAAAKHLNLSISAVYRRKEKLLKKLRSKCEKN